MTDRVLLIADVRQHLGFPSDRAAGSWLRRKRIPTIRVGRRIVVLESTLFEHLKAMESVPNMRCRIARKRDVTPGQVRRAVTDAS